MGQLTIQLAEGEMNQKKVKKLRNEVYGDYSHRKREYKYQSRKGTMTGAIENIGLRSEYLKLKKAYKNG